MQPLITSPGQRFGYILTEEHLATKYSLNRQHAVLVRWGSTDMWHRWYQTLHHAYTLTFNCCSDIWRVCRNLNGVCEVPKQADGCIEVCRKIPNVSFFRNASIILWLPKHLYLSKQREMETAEHQQELVLGSHSEGRGQSQSGGVTTNAEP